ncbi:MAG: bifunctional DNA-formamidopyrimidine glycosylase/DNA-(apurinic or apyrimidinic site) lyase [Pseudomonadota bacterium]
MPELPEVETIRRGLEPHLVDRLIESVVVRETRLRYPLSLDLPGQLMGQRIERVGRRGKYLQMAWREGGLLIHLGMSGSLRLSPRDTPPRVHDHLSLTLANGPVLHFHDPRRFGLVLWSADPGHHPLLERLGPEPWDAGFNGGYLHQASHNRQRAIKALLLDQTLVAGVGNIYASEALFLAGIHPARSAGDIAKKRYERLVSSIRSVLDQAIIQGGTTLRDFRNEQDRPGYFAQSLKVYGRTGQPCQQCAGVVCEIRIGQRSSFYCPACQH